MSRGGAGRTDAGERVRFSKAREYSADDLAKLCKEEDDHLRWLGGYHASKDRYQHPVISGTRCARKAVYEAERGPVPASCRVLAACGCYWCVSPEHARVVRWGIAEHAEETQRFLDLVQAGLTDTRASAIAGLSARKVAKWLSDGRADLEDGKESALADFAASHALAEALCVDELHGRVLDDARSSSATSVGSAKWLLERLDRKRYGEKTVIAHGLSDDLEGKSLAQILEESVQAYQESEGRNGNET